MKVKTIKDLPEHLHPDKYLTYKSYIDRPLTPKADIDIICKLTAAKKPKFALEIGTAQGYGTKAISMNMPDGLLYTIDLAGNGTFCSEKEIGNAAKDCKNVRFLRGDSRYFNYKKAGVLNCDLAFIDGCHDENNVLIDTYRVLNINSCNAGTMIIWHDYNSPYKTDHVTEVVNGLADQIEGQIYHIEGSWIAFVILGEY